MQRAAARRGRRRERATFERRHWSGRRDSNPRKVPARRLILEQGGVALPKSVLTTEHEVERLASMRCEPSTLLLSRAARARLSSRGPPCSSSRVKSMGRSAIHERHVTRASQPLLPTSQATM
jgi:hypothetical protein